MASGTELFAVAGPVTIRVAGASVAAMNVSTVILATGGAAALALAGYGVYRYLSHQNPVVVSEGTSDPGSHGLVRVDQQGTLEGLS